MLPVILASLWWQHDQAPVEVDFAPIQPSDFRSALASKHKQSDYVAKRP
jgi:hypothetical protein